ncbi:MAG: SIR2 family protein [Deltaproteobacteria bacterium]|nr:SIR2 family protein [Deltaproteobacteria bacterium]
MAFTEDLLKKLKQQIHSKNVGFLLGAGSSYLDGEGYPLAGQLWDAVKKHLPKDDQKLIQQQIDRGSFGLEEALDRSDEVTDGKLSLRQRVASAIAEQFKSRNPPLDHHVSLVRGLSSRRDRRVPVFNLNYDPLVERAADEASVLLTDGYCGVNKTFFLAQSFDYRIGLPDRRKGKPIVDPKRGILNLFKLHGSMGWYVDTGGNVRRGRPEEPIPNGGRLLMIPPHYRKGQDTGLEPYATIWSEFRGVLTNDKSKLLSRLICVGYGMRDTHVNPILEAARARSNFTLIILAQNLNDPEFNHWKTFNNVIIATETRCVLYQKDGPGVPEVWSFEWLSKEVSNG